MDNKHHVSINKVIMSLDPNIYKSRNHFIVDALDFYIENAGKELLTIPGNPRYLTREDMGDIKRDIVDTAVSEAKNEMIKLLMGASYTAQPVIPANRLAAKPPEDGKTGPPEDDEVLIGNAMKWYSADDCFP
jgi:hypothetical protein